jgi:hypothetical protein
MTHETLQDLTPAGLSAVIEHFKEMHDQARVNDHKANTLLVKARMEQFRRNNSLGQSDLD